MKTPNEPTDELPDAPPATSTKPLDPRLLRYAKSSRGFFAAITLVSIAHTILILAFAWLLTKLIVELVDGTSLEQITPYLAAFAAVIIARTALIWLREKLASRAAARAEAELRTQLLNAVSELGSKWLDSQNGAKLAIATGRGLSLLEAYFGRYLPQLVQTVVATPIIVLVMWWQDWISGLTVLITLPLIPFFMALIGLATKAVQQKQWGTLKVLAARFSDTVQGLSTLKIFGRQNRVVASTERVTDRYRRETIKVLRVSFLSGFALELLASLSVAVVAVSIGFRLVDGSMLLMTGLFVLLLAPEAYLPLRQVGVQFHAAAEGVAATDDIFEVLDAARSKKAADAASVSPVKASTTPGSQQVSTPNELGKAGALRAENLSTIRANKLMPALSFSAGPESITLITGPSGSGKSSFFAALRGASSYRGSLRFNGINIATLEPERFLAWSGQSAGLMSGTVAENITIGDENNQELLHEAMQLAQAEDIDPQLLLGVAGAGLSGGQSQRISVARAIYRFLRGHAAVIALDEPSAALDEQTEARLWQSLVKLRERGAVILLISHRTSAATIANQIIELNPAQISTISSADADTNSKAQVQ